jgi:F-type H+-transporting ATPase subunit epsilon
MRLLITTPTGVVIDDGDVETVRAEDESGSFGILRGHADLLTALTVSVVSWRRVDGEERYCAVRRGVLTVADGNTVAIATREAAMGDDLNRLEADVLDRFRDAAEAERTARTESMRLHMRAIREIVKYLRPQHAPGFGDGG